MSNTKRSRSETPRDCIHKRVRHEHGTLYGYTHDGCGCPPCTAANREYQARYRRERAQRTWNAEAVWTPSCGITRRLQALALNGWSPTALAPHIGITRGGIDQLRRTRSTWSLESKAARVRAAYDMLWDKTPPATAGAKRTATWAKRNGWAPPLAWDDDTIDDPTAKPNYRGDDIVIFDPVLVGRIAEGSHRIPPGVISAERTEAIRVLAARRYNDSEIAERIGSTRDAVTATRLRTGIPPGVPSTRPDQRRDEGEAA